MTSFEVLNEKPIPIVEVKGLIGKRKDYTYEQKLALEHAKEFSKISEKNAKSLGEELAKLEIRRLKDKDIVKIIDMMPKSVDELKVILSSSTTPMTKEEMTSVIEIVKKYI
ncbi:MAG: hypothetical protein PHW96_00810 [Candidatus Nanoarchaeia archaeon]|nr:hypothetical protein [Candidatus Nanoarchaeia archaeon]